MTKTLSRNAIEALPVFLSHVLHTHTPPGHNRDPFDRLLVSQALFEKLPLLSANPQISHYPAEVIW